MMRCLCTFLDETELCPGVIAVSYFNQDPALALHAAYVLDEHEGAFRVVHQRRKGASYARVSLSEAMRVYPADLKCYKRRA